jgi:hypothetical protein
MLAPPLFNVGELAKYRSFDNNGKLCLVLKREPSQYGPEWKYRILIQATGQKFTVAEHNLWPASS